MNTATNAAIDTGVAAGLTIPVLGDLPLAVVPSSFAAFKEEEMISFVRKYDPRIQSIPGYRHAIIRYRNIEPKKGEQPKADKPAQMVTIPQLALTDDYLLPELASRVLQGVLEDEQDAIIKQQISEGKSVIHWDTLTLDLVLASLTALRVSNRLTKEQIDAWAKIALVPVCNQRADQVSEAKQYNPEQAAKQRAGTLNVYCDLATKLAAPVPNLGMEQATALSNLLILSKLDDDLVKVLRAKLHAILNPKVLDGMYL